MRLLLRKLSKNSLHKLFISHSTLQHFPIILKIDTICFLIYYVQYQQQSQVQAEKYLH